MKDGIPLYRDSHHLSVAGAMALEARLLMGLMTWPAAPIETPAAQNSVETPRSFIIGRKAQQFIPEFESNTEPKFTKNQAHTVVVGDHVTPKMPWYVSGAH